MGEARAVLLEIPVPPREGNVTIGAHVEAAFRLFDVLPFGVRQDLAALIYLYLHDPAGYRDKRASLFSTPPAGRPSDVAAENT